MDNEFRPVGDAWERRWDAEREGRISMKSGRYGAPPGLPPAPEPTKTKSTPKKDFRGEHRGWDWWQRVVRGAQPEAPGEHRGEAPGIDALQGKGQLAALLSSLINPARMPRGTGVATPPINPHGGTGLGSPGSGGGGLPDWMSRY